jgi:hypothetical protein
MENHGIKWQIGISTIPALFLIGHLVWPDARIDTITLILLGMCFIPWLGTIFKSIELPGGMKFEYQSLRKIEQEVQKFGLLKSDDKQISDPTYLALIEQNPNLALAALRIDIERKLRAIAGVDPETGPFQSLHQIVNDMQSSGLLTPIQESSLISILSILNSAVHGKNITSSSAYEVMGLGQRLLNSLDRKLQKKKL